MYKRDAGHSSEEVVSEENQSNEEEVVVKATEKLGDLLEAKTGFLTLTPEGVDKLTDMMKKLTDSFGKQANFVCNFSI